MNDCHFDYETTTPRHCWECYDCSIGWMSYATRGDGYGGYYHAIKKYYAEQKKLLEDHSFPEWQKRMWLYYGSEPGHLRQKLNYTWLKDYLRLKSL